MSKNLQRLRMLVALAVAACASSASAAGWRYLEPQSVGEQTPYAFLFGSDDSVWTFHGDYLRRTGSSQFPDAVAAGGRFDGSGNSYGVVLNDGGAVLYGRLNYACDLIRVDTQLETRWRIKYAQCPLAASNAKGVVWLAGDGFVRRVGDDGAEKVRVDVTGYGSAGFRADTLTVGVDGSVAVSLRNANGKATVAVYDVDGRSLWVWRNDATRVTQMAFAGSRDVVFVGETQTSVFGSFDRFVARIGSTGSPVWGGSWPGPNFGTPETYLVVGPHGYDAIATGSGDVSLLRVSADGQSGTLHFSVCASSTDRFAASPTGDLIVACPGFGGTTLLRRFPANRDDLVVERRLSLPYVSNIAYRSNGELLISGFDNGTSRLLLLDRNLVEIATPLANPRQAEARSLESQFLARDGASYLVSRSGGDSDAHAVHLVKIDAGGTRTWSRDLDAGLKTVHTGAGGDRVCVARRSAEASPTQDALRIECFAGADGSVAWRATIGIDPLRQTEAFVGDDGSYAVVYSFNGALRLARFNRSGIPEPEIAGDGPVTLADLTAAGLVVFTGGSSLNQRVQRFDRSGALRFSVPMTSPDYSLSPVAVSDADDGGAFVLSDVRGRREHELRSLARDGSIRWRKTLVNINAVDVARIVRRDNEVYVVQTSATATAAGLETTMVVTRFAPENGAIQWQFVSRAPYAAFDARPLRIESPSVDFTGDRLVVARTSKNHIRLELVDRATGALIAERRTLCADTCSEVRQAVVGADGLVRVALSILDRTTGRTAALQALDAPQVAPLARLDQAGIAGAWWAPYANGEGFVLDYLPASRTVFMPWFTFSREGGNDPAGQRWYVVQGGVAANATSAELPITLATGGTFDAGPPVPATIVGTATLTFTDCDNGTLQYRFDAAHNGGATGSITLSRLSPATQDCLLPDGTTQARTVAPVNGFDARMSGSWYEEATAGQGLQFAVQPGGIFFAPWFTYDPAGTSNDPGEQHWYTIQGSLAEARNGVVTLPIVQTIGGAFDSVPTNNMYAVGQATITLLACDRAKLDYRFDDNELAGPVRARSGSIDLAKAGGCTAP